MSSRRPVRQLLVAVLLGVLVGGGLMAVTPAGAEVSQAATTSWKKIWKKELKPLAAKAFYTKSKANQTFATKAESAAGDAAANAATDAKLGSYYKKTESDAKYAGAGSSYTKAESDAKYAPYPRVVRGSFSVISRASGAGQEFSSGYSFGVTFPSAPIAHFINAGDVPPAGCSGTPDAPDAAPGHLCVFESVGTNVGARGLFGVDGILGTVSPFGFNSYAISAATGTIYSYGSWAARPGGNVTASRPAPGAPTVGR